MQDGQPFTAVNAYTWFWPDPGSFRELTAMGHGSGVWAQATVTPTDMSRTVGSLLPARRGHRAAAPQA